jgi:hypothetical protein
MPRAYPFRRIGCMPCLYLRGFLRNGLSRLGSALGTAEPEAAGAGGRSRHGFRNGRRLCGDGRRLCGDGRRFGSDGRRLGGDLSGVDLLPNGRYALELVLAPRDPLDDPGDRERERHDSDDGERPDVR